MLNLFRLVSFLVFLGFSPSASADEEAVPIEAGDPAPFSGTLLTNEAAASLLAEIYTCSERSTADLQFKLDSLRAECELDISLSKIRLESQEERYKSIIQSQDQQLDYLLNANTGKKLSKEATFVIGFVSGALITTATVYGISSL